MWQNLGIYWAKTIGDISGYSWQKLWDILGKNYVIYYGIYWLKIFAYICQNSGIYWSIGYIKLKLGDGLGEYGIKKGKIKGYTKGYIFQKLWDIFVKRYGYICLKLRDILGKIMGDIMGYNWQYF